MEKHIIMLSNGDLKFNMERILDNQVSLEEDNQKLAIAKSEDFDLDNPYAIDVEDTSYFYAEETERDNDYSLLCKILSNSSKKFSY
jgi:hypothetical protein